ncbi:MAG: hypothetical protein FVQ83_16815 [Chloroflexi bacterium]|nr:hypothetical protein [Chloroflexota bacterium]
MAEGSKKSPKLRTVDKVKPPYSLNRFPANFGYQLGKELIYLLITKSQPTLEGQEWEEIFASSIGAEWKPSNVGLDDVVLGSCAWGAKTVKASNPSEAKTVRLISGRNSPAFSFGETQVLEVDPNRIGEMVLEIWNERVSAIRKKYKHLRSVILIKSQDLLEVVVFEFETIRFEPGLFYWEWNKRNNLEGFENENKKHRFTWQPHGSQFTIKEEVPKDVLIVKVTSPPKVDKETILKGIGFQKDWITVSGRNG